MTDDRAEAPRQSTPDLTIIGGGIMGLCTAYYAARCGARVLLLEKDEIGRGATYGNAGLVVPSHITPLAAPSIIGKGLRWMLDPESPFYIKPRWDPDLFRWLWAFRSYCTEAHVREASKALLELNVASAALYGELQDDGILDDGCYTRNGLLYLYQTRKSFEQGVAESESLTRSGFQMEVLDSAAVRKLTPTASPDIAGGVHHLESGHVVPDRLIDCLRRAVESLGVEIRTGVEAVGLLGGGGKVEAVETPHGRLPVERLVLASGALAPALLLKVGVRLPLQPGKGYSVTVKVPQPKMPPLPMILSEGYVAVTPMADRLRFAGTLELSGVNHSIDPRRIAGVLKTVNAFLPGLGDWETLETWAGLRPCLPDGLPAIGKPRGWRNLVVAAGHAKIGILLGPITGRLTAQHILGDPTSLNLAPYALDRFA